jgi:hypothetical protein
VIAARVSIVAGAVLIATAAAGWLIWRSWLLLLDDTAPAVLAAAAGLLWLLTAFLFTPTLPRSPRRGRPVLALVASAASARHRVRPLGLPPPPVAGGRTPQVLTRVRARPMRRPGPAITNPTAREEDQ